MDTSVLPLLDARQRAMLRAMGVTLGWPEAPPGVAPVATKTIAASADSTVAAARLTGEPTGQPPRPDVEAQDWPALRQQVRNCRACTRCHDSSPPWLSPASALPQADWMVVAELPQRGHAHEDLTFAGDAGLLLDNILGALGLRRAADGVPRQQAAYLTLAVKCHGEPARNPGADEVATCARYLAREAALVQPRVVLALGRWAALALLHAEHSALAHQPLGKLRGQIWRFEGRPVVVSYPLAYLLHKPVEKARAWNDWALALHATQGSG